MGRHLQIVHIGLGLMGGIYTDILRRHPLARQWAIVDQDFSKYHNTHPTFDLERPHQLKPANLMNFLDSKVDQFDGFLISSPSDTHVPLIKQLAKYVKPIYTEKPLGLTREECEEAYAAVGDTPLIVGMTRRYERGFQEVKAKVDSGAVGQIQSVMTMLGDYPGPPIKFLQNCGGIVADLAIHDIDYMLHLKGEMPKIVYTVAKKQMQVYKEAKVDDYCVVQMQFADGTVSMHQMRRYAPGGYDIRVEVLGSEGNARLENIPETKVLFSDESGNLKDGGYPSFPTRFYNAYAEEVQEFLQIIADRNKKPRVTKQEVINAMAVVAAAELSAQEERPVAMAEVL